MLDKLFLRTLQGCNLSLPFSARSYIPAYDTAALYKDEQPHIYLLLTSQDDVDATPFFTVVTSGSQEGWKDVRTQPLLSTFAKLSSVLSAAELTLGSTASSNALFSSQIHFGTLGNILFPADTEAY